MLENNPGLARQEVRFELDEAQRKLDNIGTLSGRYLSLATLGDTRSPLGHQVPGLCHNILVCKDLLIGYEERHGGTMTFADLRRMDPSVHKVFCQAIQQVRSFDREIQYQIACEKLGRKP